MTRTLKQVVLSLLDREALRARRITQEVGPAVREFYRLKSLLRKLALDNHDCQLGEWLNAEWAQFEAEREEVNGELSKLENAEKNAEKLMPKQTDEEMLAEWERLDKLSELATQRLALHVEFIQRFGTRLKAKLAEIESNK